MENNKLETHRVDSLASLYEKRKYLQLTHPEYVEKASYCLFKDGHIDNAIATYNNECISYEDDVVIINEGKIGEVTQMLYDTLTGIQWGKIEDSFNWIYKL